MMFNLSIVLGSTIVLRLFDLLINTKNRTISSEILLRSMMEPCTAISVISSAEDLKVYVGRGEEGTNYFCSICNVFTHRKSCNQNVKIMYWVPPLISAKI